MLTWVSHWEVCLNSCDFSQYWLSQWAFFSVDKTCWVWRPLVERMSLKYTDKSASTQSSCRAFRQKLLCCSESVAITPNDARWVGAWWIGFLISSGLMFISAIPFWFLPRSPLRPEEDESRCGDKDGAVAAVSSENNLKLADIAKSWGNPLIMCLSAQLKTLWQCWVYADWSNARAFLPAEFFPSLKRLLGTSVFCLFLCASILRFNAIIGQITYTPKYMEQQFGLSTSRANFLVGKKKYGSISRDRHCPLVEDRRINHKSQPQIAVTKKHYC